MGRIFGSHLTIVAWLPTIYSQPYISDRAGPIRGLLYLLQDNLGYPELSPRLFGAQTLTLCALWKATEISNMAALVMMRRPQITNEFGRGMWVAAARPEDDGRPAGRPGG